MNAAETSSAFEALAPNPECGLPEEVFLSLTRLTPMINVDLLIRDTEGRVLLTWREDRFYPAGWHIPGGIIRFRERIGHRIVEVARQELGTTVTVTGGLLNVQEFIEPERRTRGHFISLLYECELCGEPERGKAYPGGVPRHGQWCWFQRCPDNLLKVHEVYRKFICPAANPEIFY